MLKALKNTLIMGAAVGALSLTAAKSEEVKVWTLTFANDSANQAWSQIVSDFEASNPGITIRIENRGVDEHKAALRVASSSDQGPDIYFMWAGLGLGGEFVHAGLSLPLDEYYDEYKWDDLFLPSALGYSHQYEAGRHGVPYTFHGEALYYNRALFEQAGITSEPTTYEELLAVAEKLKAAGIPAMTFGGTVNWHLMRLMDQLVEVKCGAEKHDQLTSLTLNWATEPCATAAFEELHMWTANYILSPFMGIDQAQSFNLFLGNRAAMMLEGDWLVGQLRGENRLDDFDVFPFPNGTDRLYSFAEYNYISSKSALSDAAATFLNYLGSTEVQQKFLGQFGSISVNADVSYENVSAIDQKWLDIFAEYTSTFVNGDQAFPLDVTTEYFRVINEVASENLAPADAAADLQKFIDNRR